MIVLGIDPGSRRLGWGVVARHDRPGSPFAHVAHGVVQPALDTLAERLVHIERELDAITARFQITHASVEGMFFHKDAQAAAKLGHARGVALLVCARRGLPIAEYAPARVKSAITGSGRAEKAQVAEMVRVLLKLDALPKGDAADALAIAITHLHHAPFLAALGTTGVPRQPRQASERPAIRGRPSSPFEALVAALGPSSRRVKPRSPSSV